MNRVVRAVLVWLMVIAMPVQGMAASTMLSCGPGHGRMMAGLAFDAQAARSSEAGEPMDGHVHAHVDAHHAPHDHATQGDAAASHAAADADGADSLLPHHGSFGCSACAACCSVLALPTGYSLPEAPGPMHPVRMPLVEPVASHQPDGLDRPPRTVLA